MTTEEALADVTASTNADDAAEQRRQIEERDRAAADSYIERVRAERRREFEELRKSAITPLPEQLQSAAATGGPVGRKPETAAGGDGANARKGASVRGIGGTHSPGVGQPAREVGSRNNGSDSIVRTDTESPDKPRGLKSAKPDPIPFPTNQTVVATPKKVTKGALLPFMPAMKAWTKQEAEAKEPELREMWETYGEYADEWLQKKCNDPELQIWDFTPAEMKAILRWCLKRGQTNAVIAWSLDRALDGRTDVDFAVIMGSKVLETGFRLGIQQRFRRKP